MGLPFSNVCVIRGAYGIFAPENSSPGSWKWPHGPQHHMPRDEKETVGQFLQSQELPCAQFSDHSHSLKLLSIDGSARATNKDTGNQCAEPCRPHKYADVKASLCMLQTFTSHIHQLMTSVKFPKDCCASLHTCRACSPDTGAATAGGSQVNLGSRRRPCSQPRRWLKSQWLCPGSSRS